jgi:hypothetical protein
MDYSPHSREERKPSVKPTSLLFLLAFAAFWPVSFCNPAHAAEPAQAKRDRTWVDRRVQEWQPTRAERAFDEIAWAKDIREAEQLARKHARPIFLFTYDGANLACYRC